MRSGRGFRELASIGDEAATLAQLIDNALAAMVSARSPQRELRVITEVATDGVRVLIEDTGPGIPEADRETGEIE